ncbi:hypothetical protein LINPERPRIM_LOCUS4412 [Linum perenne]
MWEVAIIHTYPEGNSAADFLASSGHSASLGVHSFPIPHPSLGCFFLYDSWSNFLFLFYFE